MICKKSPKGFTLIEVLIYVAIIGVVISSFVSFSISSTNARNKTYVIQEVQANARVVKELISREIKEASSVVAPSSGSSTSVLELDVPDTSNNTLYSLSNGVLYRQVGSFDPDQISSQETEISDLVFSNNSLSGDKDSVTFSFTIDFRNSDSNFFDYSESLSGSANIRR